MIKALIVAVLLLLLVKIFLLQSTDSILSIILNVFLIAILIALLATLVERTRRSSPNGLLGCRVKYMNSGGTAFGYIAKEHGDRFVVQNPWKQKETLVGKDHVKFIQKEDWDDLKDPMTGKGLFDVESEAGTKRMFDFYGITPKDCDFPK